MRLLIALVATAAILAGATAAAGAAEQIDLGPADPKLHATLFKPAGTGPFPAVVAMHDCDGLTGRGSVIAPWYQDWGERLAARGFAVLFPDSFAARGIAQQCHVPAIARAVRASRERIGDANAARRWLQEQSWIIPNRISLMGWSDGGTAALWSVRPYAGGHDGKADFRSAVAFYPGCRRLRDLAWSARVPTLILTGAADDWTPAHDCQQMVEGARGRSAGARIVIYPDAYHDFDRADLAVHVRTEVARTQDPSGRVHVGTNTAAREDALKRVPAWLAR
ncbi:MAG: dienelactone hydrolase family protein [Xanthobacteraceae bacterium]